MKLLKHIVKPTTNKTILSWLTYLHRHCQVTDCHRCNFNHNDICEVLKSLPKQHPLEELPPGFSGSPAAWELPEFLLDGTPINAIEPPNLDFLETIFLDDLNNFMK